MKTAFLIATQSQDFGDRVFRERVLKILKLLHFYCLDFWTNLLDRYRKQNNFSRLVEEVHDTFPELKWCLSHLQNNDLCKDVVCTEPKFDEKVYIEKVNNLIVQSVTSFFSSLESLNRNDPKSIVFLDCLCFVFSSLLPNADYSQYLTNDDLVLVFDRYIQNLHGVTPSSNVDDQVKYLLDILTYRRKTIALFDFLVLILWLIRFLKSPVGQELIRLLIRIIILILQVIDYVKSDIEG